MPNTNRILVPWTPTEFIRIESGPFATSMGTAKVKTNATFGYLKVLGNDEGPHALAREYVGSSLAKWFGLNVPDFAILNLEAIDCYPLPKNAKALPGPAFVSRHIAGRTWGKDEAELPRLENPADITRLVVFDNWVRNYDRHPPDLRTWKPNYANVYFGETERPEWYRLYAIDHTHCFERGQELQPSLDSVGKIQDDGVYGLFTQFVPRIDRGELAWCKAMLQSLERDAIRAIVAGIPREWDVPDAARTALIEFVLKRAGYLASKIESGWGVDFWEPRGV